MPSRNTYRQRLFVYYFSVFLLFAIILLVFQFSREKRYKTDELDRSLDQVAGITDRYIKLNSILNTGDFSQLDSLHLLLPDQDTRITVISDIGKVYYDSSVEDESSMENHISRPEIIKATNGISGANIRKSTTTGFKYYYYAKKYDDYFIRIAVRYSVEVKSFLKAEKIFWFVFFAAFLVVGFVLYLVTGKMGEAITKLKELTVRLKSGEVTENSISFPDNELGFIGKEIYDIYYKLNGTKNELINEKERLVSHLGALNEGVGMFSQNKNEIYHNNNFIHYLNMIGDKPVKSPNSVFKLSDFKKINKFLLHQFSKKSPKNISDLPRLEYTIESNSRYFNVFCVIFPDRSFEINITDVTRPEKRRIFKQQMTANIAHELKTPVASVIGFLETILETPEMDKDTQKNFLEKAYQNAERLADLISDIVVLNKMEEASDNFEIEKVDVPGLLNELQEFYEHTLKASNKVLKVNVGEGIALKGNRSLLHSVFQNLLENAINYAGSDGIIIEINHYLEDKDFHYFSFRDNGKGVDEIHLNRLFERFYRVDKGRTRKSGGTGLGLAIVKNAVLMHKGEINVRNGKDGGLEFLFSLPKF